MAENIKEDIRKILLLHENTDKVLTDYVEAKIAEESDNKFIGGFIWGVIFIVVVSLVYIFIKYS